MFKHAKLLMLGLVVLIGALGLGCNVLSLPDVAGTWDLNFYIDGSNCPDEISPPMTQQVWIVQQNESKVTVIIQSVDGESVNFEFSVNATIQADGNFSFNETFYQQYKSYYLRMNVICNATISDNSISGDIQLSLQDMDTYESCVEYGTVEGTRRAS